MFGLGFGSLGFLEAPWLEVLVSRSQVLGAGEWDLVAARRGLGSLAFGFAGSSLVFG